MSGTSMSCLGTVILLSAQQPRCRRCLDSRADAMLAACLPAVNSRARPLALTRFVSREMHDSAR